MRSWAFGRGLRMSHPILAHVACSGSLGTLNDSDTLHVIARSALPSERNDARRGCFGLGGIIAILALRRCLLGSKGLYIWIQFGKPRFFDHAAPVVQNSSWMYCSEQTTKLHGL